MRWLPVVLVIAACDPTPTRTISELSGRKVLFNWSPVRDDPGKMDVFVELDYQLDECVAVDATATLDGRPLEVVTRGSGGQDQHGGSYCDIPGWSAVVPAGGDPASTSTIEIADDTAAITYELTNPLAERTIRASTGGSMSLFPGPCSDSPGPAGNLVLPPGQEVTLSWSPATDQVNSAILFGRSETFDPVFYLSSAHITIAGSAIRFVAPANAAQATKATIEGDFALATRRCEGADACSARRPYCSEITVRTP